MKKDMPMRWSPNFGRWEYEDGSPVPTVNRKSVKTEQPVKAFKKFDDAKLRWHLMPEAALEEVLKVLEFGAKRYGDLNWLEHADEVQWTRYMNALERHLKRFKRGTDKDPDSSNYELAHIACNALMLLTLQLKNKGTDDRAKD